MVKTHACPDPLPQKTYLVLQLFNGRHVQVFVLHGGLEFSARGAHRRNSIRGVFHRLQRKRGRLHVELLVVQLVALGFIHLFLFEDLWELEREGGGEVGETPKNRTATGAATTHPRQTQSSLLNPHLQRPPLGRLLGRPRPRAPNLFAQRDELRVQLFDLFVQAVFGKGGVKSE